MILRRVARPLLAAVFVSGGIETLRNPKPHIQAAEPLVDKTVGQVRDKVPERIPTDTETLVKLDAAVKVGAGVMFGLGKFPGCPRSCSPPASCRPRSRRTVSGSTRTRGSAPRSRSTS